MIGNLRKSKIGKPTSNNEAKPDRECGLVVKDLEQNPENVALQNSNTEPAAASNAIEDAENGLESSRNTTIEDLFDTLKQLEQPDDFPETNLKTKKFLVENSSADMNFTSSDSSMQSSSSKQDGSSAKKPIENKRLNEILEFLDQADKEEEAILSGRAVKTNENKSKSFKTIDLGLILTQLS